MTDNWSCSFFCHWLYLDDLHKNSLMICVSCRRNTRMKVENHSLHAIYWGAPPVALNQHALPSTAEPAICFLLLCGWKTGFREKIQSKTLVIHCLSVSVRMSTLLLWPGNVEFMLVQSLTTFFYWSTYIYLHSFKGISPLSPFLWQCVLAHLQKLYRLVILLYGNILPWMKEY